LLAWLTFREVLFAKERIGRHIRRTPFVRSTGLSQLTSSSTYLKLENWQLTRSFKVRGALNKLLQLGAEELSRGVITASTGNHAQAVAHAARLVGTDALIIVPENTPRSKVAGTRALGGTVHEEGGDYDESEVIARRLAREHDRVFVHGFNDADIVAGQGTIGLEMLQQNNRLGTLVVPVGGGGLISGIALAAKSLDPKLQVIGVQSEASCPMTRSFHAGEMQDVEYSESIADGLYGGIAQETLAMVLEHVDDMIAVSEDDIHEAIRWLVAEERLIVEGAGAVGVAAVLSGRLRPHGRGDIGVVLSGGNIDYSTLQPLMRRP